MTKVAKKKKIQSEKADSSISGAGNTRQLHVKNEIGKSPNIIHKNLKWIKDWNIRPDVIKLLEENIGRTLFDINCINIFFDPLPRVMEMKKKCSLIKLKSFCTAKEIINKMKRQPSEWKKIFANYVTKHNLSPKFTNSSWGSISKKKKKKNSIIIK